MGRRATNRGAYWVTLDYGLLIPAKEQYAGECLEGGSYLQEGGLCDLGFRSLVSC